MTEGPIYPGFIYTDFYTYIYICIFVIFTVLNFWFAMKVSDWKLKRKNYPK